MRRTYTKLIATIQARQGTGGLRPCVGVMGQGRGDESVVIRRFRRHQTG
jgi:hypothetical protein